MLQVYIIFSIFYLFKSGYPQIADIILACGIAYGFIQNIRVKNSYAPSLRFVILTFAFYTFFINIIHYLFLPDLRFILSSMYYLFNALVFIFLIRIAYKSPEMYQKILYNGIIVTVLLQGFLALVMPMTEGPRLVGTFNNPNQITYWALISFCLLVILKYGKKLETLDTILIAVLGFIILSALSKAGIVVYFFFCIALLFSTMLNSAQKMFISLLLLALMLFALLNFDQVAQRLHNVQVFSEALSRVSDIGGQTDDSLSGRGYDRIVEHPEYIFLGAGEGGYKRFGGITIKGHELHSGPGTILFSYGLAGTLLFCLFLYAVFKRLPPMMWILLVGLMMYGMTHQNFRNTYFWVFMATAHWITISKAARRKEQGFPVILEEPPSPSA